MKQEITLRGKDSMCSPRKNFSDLPIITSGETMLETFLNKHWNCFGIFDEVYVFGSAVSSDTPRDLDILLVYPDGQLPAVPNAERQILVELTGDFPGLPIHLITMSQSELASTKFLELIRYFRIK